jgi:hypothetical protein
MVKIPVAAMPWSGGRYCDDYERNNSAEDGYRMGNRSRVKIRSAAQALWLGNADRRGDMRFVTFTFPELPEAWRDKPESEQDEFLYRLFHKFRKNETVNYGLKKYLWVNERQQRGFIHFHCLFLYEKKIDYATTVVCSAFPAEIIREIFFGDVCPAAEEHGGPHATRRRGKEGQKEPRRTMAGNAEQTQMSVLSICCAATGLILLLISFCCLAMMSRGAKLFDASIAWIIRSLKRKLTGRSRAGS